MSIGINNMIKRKKHSKPILNGTQNTTFWVLIMHGVSELRILVRGGRISLLLVRERAEGLCFARISGTGPRLSRPRPRWGIWSDRISDMLFMSKAMTYEMRLPSEAEIPRFRGSALPVISGTGADTMYFSTP